MTPNTARLLRDRQGYPLESTARSQATNSGAPNVLEDAVRRPSDAKWVPVVRIRSDQLWMQRHIEERGLPVLLVGEVLSWSESVGLPGTDDGGQR